MKRTKNKSQLIWDLIDELNREYTTISVKLIKERWQSDEIVSDSLISRILKQWKEENEI